MAEFYGDCARDGGQRSNCATSMAENLLYLFTNRIADLYQSSHNTMDSFYAIRASMFTDGLKVSDLEAKAIELQTLVERLESKGHEVDNLLRQVDLEVVSKLLSTLPMYRNLTEEQARGVVMEYCEDVRLKFYWLRPQALAVKKMMIAGTVLQAQRTRIELF